MEMQVVKIQNGQNRAYFRPALSQMFPKLGDRTLPWIADYKLSILDFYTWLRDNDLFRYSGIYFCSQRCVIAVLGV